MHAILKDHYCVCKTNASLRGLKIANQTEFLGFRGDLCGMQTIPFTNNLRERKTLNISDQLNSSLYSQINSFLKKLFIYYLFIIFIFGCVGSSFLCEGFLQLRQVGTTLYRGLSCCGAQAPDTQVQQLWLTGPVAPRHVGSSQTRARTRVPCIGRQTPNHCSTREAPTNQFLSRRYTEFIIHFSFMTISQK